LSNLGIWQEVRQGVMSSWVIKPSFKQNLFAGIFKNQKPQDVLQGEAASAADQTQSFDPKFIEKLDNYSSERWEVIVIHKMYFVISIKVNPKILYYDCFLSQY
jgi:hypothetical protein